MLDWGRVPTTEEVVRHIEEARQLLRPKPVKQDKVPKWFQGQVRRRLGIKDRHPLDSFDKAREATRCDDALDHIGSFQTEKGGLVFVSEPYTNIEAIEQAKQFAAILGLRLEISSNSWWFPGRTIRLEFTPDLVN